VADIQIGVATATWWQGLTDLPFTAYLDFAAAVGAQVVDLPLHAGWPNPRPDSLRFAPDDVERIRSACARAGVGIATIGGYDDFVQPTAQGLAEQVGMVTRLVDLAAALGVPVVTVLGGRRRDGPSDTRAAALVTEGLARIGRHAESREVLVALESPDFLAAPDALLRVLRDAGSPALRIVLDTGTLVRRGPDAATALRSVETLAPLTVHTHLGNGRGRGEAFAATRLADGELDVGRVLDALFAAGYAHPVCVQYEGPDDAAIYADDVRFVGAWIDRRRGRT
jgi:sugar phosphate isomerase/epimerase